VRRAAAGERITITDRGKPVAVLGPPIGTVDLDAAAEAGWLTKATTSGLRPVPRRPPVRSVQEALDEDRAE
jgi:antitoxin (DNA-binding transcriptional repressor) of toxin-antitoxin stability system